MTRTESDARTANQTTGSVLLDCSSSKLLDFRLELQSMQILLTVLAHVARLGCAIRHIKATNNVVELSLGAPPHVAHRVLTCLAQLIGVQAISIRR